MASTAYRLTYGDTSLKESVLDFIELVSAQEDMLLTTLGKSTASQPVHSTVTDTLRTAQSRAVAEGDDATLLETTNPARSTNITEIVSIPFGVSGTQRASDHFGYEDRFTYEAQKAMIDWRNAAEFDLVRATLTSGASGTAPRMAGIIAGVSTNNTAQTSGTVFSESIMNGLFQLAYENANGEEGVASDIYVGAHIKRLISGFAGRSSAQQVIGSTEAVNTIDLYISDFGVHRVHLHRYVQQSADATARFLAVNPKKWSVAYLREPVLEELSKTGDSDKAQVIGELTLENKNEKHNIYASGFKKT